ncbi:MAG: lysophospholipid acyltransferase family protein [Candidatus Thiodiazotropha lotti]|nr:1-acyl-sn-glycerol-3-phosphate acyltransferase [Candidatus Thiodiazotropha lotti]MCG8010846.1 1-acyl-sn-glycerol-3-phosphate acyltransferase [Candidatus Thiodiazotropha lotti]MCW4210309.1 1-acyl-sn-glycerol-3-phosphate acyltransferase [Candidatus Thiodiazotropha lotti]MCW4215761.1 1-acyl-sn-glycerol-3-phosphate acyltransferase [Candidatus Thiodiazotropha lotti]
MLTLLLVALFLFWLNGRCRDANGADWGFFWLNRLDGLNRLFCRQYHRLQSAPVPLPRKGGAILVSNHISGLDPLLMIASCDRPLRFLIAREQYQRFGMQWLFRAVGCIPVDRENSPEKALRQAFKALSEGEVIALFPHGKIHLDSDPPRKIKPGAARLAARAKLPLIALHISGVAAPGEVMRPVFLRSRAVVKLQAVIHGSELCDEALNKLIEQALEGLNPANDGY